MDFKIVLAALIVSTATASTAANDFFRCDRTSASTQGFKKSLQNDRAALDRTYPKELKIVISEDRSWAATYYGVKRNRSGNFRKNDIIKHPSFMINGKELRTTGKIWITFGQGGKKLGQPASYTCDSPKKTRWQPED